MVLARDSRAAKVTDSAVTAPSVSSFGRAAHPSSPSSSTAAEIADVLRREIIALANERMTACDLLGLVLFVAHKPVRDAEPSFAFGMLTAELDRLDVGELLEVLLRVEVPA